MKGRDVLRIRGPQLFIPALHGPRGVGKSTFAVAYAERHRPAYRATWWIRAETEPTMRADLVSLGVELGWVRSDRAEEPAVKDVLRRLSSEGEGILLIYDNAIDPKELLKFLPRLNAAHVIVTSNEPKWADIAEPVEIAGWPKNIGADFLISRTGRSYTDEHDEAVVLSEALHGLPLAHEQAAAHCEHTGISFAAYKKLLDLGLLDRPGLSPPADPLPNASPATRFAVVGGRLAVLPPTAWGARIGQATGYHVRARAIAQNLADRLMNTDAVPDLSASVSALLDVLGENVSDVQPDQLRLASRSINAKARTYGHSAAQWEISAESVSAFFELNDVLIDLQAFARTEIEAHEAAIRNLDMTASTAGEAKAALDVFTDGVLSSTEIVEKTVELAFQNASAISDAAVDPQAKIQIEGDRVLLAANVALAIARELGRGVKETPTGPNETADALATTERSHLPRESNRKKQTAKRSTRKQTNGKPSISDNELSWASFSERVLARINAKGPEAVGDALIEAATSLIKKPRSTIAGLGAVIVLLSANAPILATGALATTIAWIAYELRRQQSQPK